MVYSKSSTWLLEGGVMVVSEQSMTMARHSTVEVLGNYVRLKYLEIM